MDTTQRDAEPGSPPAGSDGLSVGSDGLSAALLASDPMTQFARWMEDAETLGLPEPTAMVLATISAEGRPRARTVLLKGHDQSGFTFYSNRTSRKGQDLAANPRACVVFPWYAMRRQVTAEGSVRIMSQADSEPYYRSRPRGSQIGAWASRQSQVIASRAELDDRVAELERRWAPPAVSQTVARMERDGLLHVAGDRQLSLSDVGRTLATRVMRKHRLAECLLVGVIKLPWEEVHIEACRWEHVISESVERRLFELLGYPVRCPHGNLIPGLAELGLPAEALDRVKAATDETGEAMTKVVSGDNTRVVIRRIGEQIQSDLVLMLKLKRVGIQPGREVILMAGDDGVRVTAGDSMDAISTELPSQIAAHIFVSISSRCQTAAGA